MFSGNDYVAIGFARMVFSGNDDFLSSVPDYASFGAKNLLSVAVNLLQGNDISSLLAFCCFQGEIGYKACYL